MTNTYTHGLAEYIARSTFEVIPQAVVEHAKLCTFLACDITMP